ncbi:hypothetical protein B0T21DRAFT_384256 [Apiosordaria backusii]|uniref:Uncharacterized protein n=1 Tax=Apiosordaria backusii TaxID=314023 RepID=A0AA40BJJ0_9PEZI|nr:hypothetical protein B0T21DRAFT_384256 [Apiosordaria backusii]
MGGGDVPPVLAEVFSETPVAFATHQPHSSSQYVSPVEIWESESSDVTAHGLRHSPAEEGGGGFPQSQLTWESAWLRLPHSGESFYGVSACAFQAPSPSTATLGRTPPSVAQPTLTDPTELQEEDEYLLHFQPVYPAASPENTVSSAQEPAFHAYVPPNGYQGTLRDNPVVFPERETPKVCSPYVNVTKQGDNRPLKISELQDTDEDFVVPVETPLIGHWVHVTQGAALDVKQEVVVKEEQIVQRDVNMWRRDMLMKQTSDTRAMRACIRCHNQRVRCRPNTDNPNDPLAPCSTCLDVRRESKKTIHNLPCLRQRLSSVVLHRDGGLGYTNRFTHNQLIDIPASDYADEFITTIEMAQDLCKTPMRLKVRAFKAREGDKLVRHFVDKDGVTIPAYCLIEVKSAGKTFREYLAANAVKGLEESTEESDDLIKEVFGMIANHLRPSLVRSPSKIHLFSRQDRKSFDQDGFLLRAVRLWFAIRHQTGSAWLCGEETLGMDSVELKARYVPRMIVAQFDSIRYQMVFKSQAPQFLKEYALVLGSNNMGAWFPTFKVTFLFLHNVACICKDRYRHARENSQGRPMETRYGARDHTLTRFVEDVQRGAVAMLAYWMYFKRCDVMNFEWDAESVSKSPLQKLEPEQLKFLKKIVERLKAKLSSIPTTPQEGCWEHELYWVSLMFVSEPLMINTWKIPVIFSTVTPSVGNEI